MRAFEEFLQYKTRVPVRGAILLNEAMDSTVLVKGWKKGANWSFPRGKINKNEDDLDCAIREVYEETGFDIREAGLVPKHDEVKYIEISMREQQIRLYVFRNVPMETNFQPRTRKEISKIQWYKLSELPAFRKKGNHQPDDAAAASNANKFYMVAPFLVPLKKWVVQQRKKDAARAASNPHLLSLPPQDELPTEDDIATQTEPTIRPSTVTASIENLEGATRELQRLLMVQPPTQGIQMSSGVGAGDEKGDKGEALMAILQSKSLNQPPPGPTQPFLSSTTNQMPFTPGGPAYYTNHSQPQAHPHHYPQHLPPNTYQPSPIFPIATQMNQNISASYYNQVRAPRHTGPQHHGHVRNLSNLGPGRQQHKEPVLLHPQPLPPQVQQSRLTRDILPTPNLPEATRRVKVDGRGPPSFGGQFGLTYGPPQPPQTISNLAPPQMTSHSMSLLNTLKSGDRAGGAGPAPAMPIKTAEASAMQQAQHQPVPWSNVPSSRQQQPAGPLPLQNPMQPFQTSLGSAVQSLTSQAASAASATSAKPHPPTDKHRSALLDMFKKQPALSPTGTGTAGPSRVQHQLPTRAGEEAKASSNSQSPAEANLAAREANGAAIVMNPELNLPYRAFKILSRPAQGDNNSSRKSDIITQPSQQTSSPNDDKFTTQQGIPSPRAFGPPNHNHVDKGGFAHLPTFTQSAGSSYNHSQYQGFPSPHNPPAFPAAGMLQHRRESNPEQKQKLLSLFGKPQASPTAQSGDHRGRDSNPSEHVLSGAQRSRVASLASAGGEVAQGRSSSQSRRGSQTPISPADRDFLLGFLQAVTDKTH